MTHDPLLYIEQGERRTVAAFFFDAPLLQGNPGLEVVAHEMADIAPLKAAGFEGRALRLELNLNVCKRRGVVDAVVPPDFPVELADYLRAAGITLRPDAALFEHRRRAKTSAEVAGMRRAQAAAAEAMGLARDLLRRAKTSGQSLVLDEEVLTAEILKTHLRELLAARDMIDIEMIVSSGPGSAVIEDYGSGPLLPESSIIIDLWHRDRASACYADMTRTMVVGEPPVELAGYHRLVQQALEAALQQVRPGASVRDLHLSVCKQLEQARALAPEGLGGEVIGVLDEGLEHGLGHGVGLEVHERPFIGPDGDDLLCEGDVIALEPGLYRPGFGGCRLEDLVLVTIHGAELVAACPYDLIV